MKKKPTDEVNGQREIGDLLHVGVRQVQRLKREGWLDFVRPDGSSVVQSVTATGSAYQTHKSDLNAEAGRKSGLVRRIKPGAENNVKSALKAVIEDGNSLPSEGDSE